MHRLEAVQSMRALAAIMVLIGHVLAEAEHYFAVTLLPGRFPWTRGVDVFFVISGFIITLSGRRYFGRPGGTRDFLRRRVIRVVPLYWLFTTLMLVTLILAPGGVKDTTLDPGQAVASYAFLPHARPDGRIAPILSLGWTLNYEMFFYLVFSAFLTLRRPAGIIAVISTIVGLAIAGILIAPRSAALETWTNSILIEFAFGILLAEFWLAFGTRFVPSLGKGAVLLCAGLALLIPLNTGADPLPRFMAGGLPALLIIAGPVLFWQGPVAERLPRIGLVLGDSSYALYLSHRFVLRAATLAALPILPATMAGAMLYVLVVSVTACVAGILVFRHVETPMLAALGRRFPPQHARPSQAAG